MALKFNSSRKLRVEVLAEDGTLDFAIGLKFVTFEDLAGSENYSHAIARGIRQSIISWEGIVDEVGLPLEVNEDNQRMLVQILMSNHPEVFKGIQESFMEIAEGKNLKTGLKQFTSGTGNPTNAEPVTSTEVVHDVSTVVEEQLTYEK